MRHAHHIHRDELLMFLLVILSLMFLLVPTVR
jgi:hypothetical protein